MSRPDGAELLRRMNRLGDVATVLDRLTNDLDRATFDAMVVDVLDTLRAHELVAAQPHEAVG